MDKHWCVLDVLLQRHRDTEAAKMFLFRLLGEYGVPEVIHTDQLGSTSGSVLAAPVPEYRLVAFVGGFEGNAFTYSSPAPTLCMPIEMTPEWTATIFTHELTHLVHAPLIGGAGGWTRTLAAVIVQEGLATHVTERIHPDAPLEWQVGNAAWLAACTAHRMALIHDAQDHLEASDDASLLRFLQPHPEFGQERTAYALGWWVVGHWLATGRSLAELARVPESALPALVDTQFTALGTRSA